MSTHELLFQWTSTINKKAMLFWYTIDIVIISSKCNFILVWTAYPSGPRHFILSLFCVITFALFVFVQCIVTSVICISGLFIIDDPFCFL